MNNPDKTPAPQNESGCKKTIGTSQRPTLVIGVIVGALIGFMAGGALMLIGGSKSAIISEAQFNGGQDDPGQAWIVLATSLPGVVLGGLSALVFEKIRK